ncbi:twin-arginine translocation pathway signal [Rhodobacter veldkampii DSM 11550]|uniref:Twin-arginine translocation pathway signal n=1 Tax=Phaeovulum veldkampii DSM 11550 TaxID=1185920 RepID=A0A2T4JJM4_9RHOB|nr:YSC84-related protein [Phaeovulum veldkampii]MBK5945039.1 twin-arginine translocation pathway signal [Phaeovulum veldkampii DSM 11550]PTE18121.1 twin-arginine translocation pathway signal [Phaeovulum veldkampii DSM 11550]TDQ57067.1 lipid-binding SYLF domain-containing protein [Phaeovulum veldkampii DSM 11550]
MTQISRRGLILTGAASLGLAGCGNGIGTDGAAKLDARVDAMRDYLLSRYPGTQDLMSKAVGVLYMPLMTEAGFGFGGAYGRGALRINNVTVDYYSAASASFGFQIGAQQYAHALFFMTEPALAEFRRAQGWALGADARYALPDGGGAIGTDTTTTLAPVIALVFGQAGLIAGATLEGTKYTRIIP